MPCCCHLTRRQLLQWAGLVAATPLLSALDDMERAYGMTRAVRAGPMLAVNLELVTLTESTAILTWFTGDPSQPDAMGRLKPVPADTEVLLGTAQGGCSRRSSTRRDAYHYVELSGLEPGQTYFYVARFRRRSAVASANAFGNGVGSSTLDVSPSGPFTFTVPFPPPGRFLFAIALCNDLHLGRRSPGSPRAKAAAPSGNRTGAGAAALSRGDGRGARCGSTATGGGSVGGDRGHQQRGGATRHRVGQVVPRRIRASTASATSWPAGTTTVPTRVTPSARVPRCRATTISTTASKTRSSVPARRGSACRRTACA